MSDITVFHTAWMAKYDGDRTSLSASGFKFAAENGYGHEMLNFGSTDGICYGYVPPTGSLHLEKHFDVPRHAEKLEGVTFIWTAPHPEQGGHAVTGVWYNATVFREVQHPKGELGRRRLIDGEAASYLCTAKAEGCVRLKPDARPIFVRTGQPRNDQSWPGQQKVFYPKPGSPALKLLKEILNDIDPGETSTDGTSVSKPSTKRSGWQANVERRRRIEEAAVLAVHQRHRSPNAHYRIAIVTDAPRKPIINEFVMVRGQKSQWCTLDGRLRLEFEERMAARLTSVLNLETPK